MVQVRGTLTDQEIFGYQLEVWSRPEVRGYDELIDMSAVEHIALPSSDRARQLSSLSAAMDARARSSKLAIVAPEDLAFGLGRMYQAYRSLNEQSTKTVGVFRSLPDAVAWLGIEDRGPARDNGGASNPADL
jgi:hypothetical protein